MKLAKLFFLSILLFTLVGCCNVCNTPPPESKKSTITPCQKAYDKLQGMGISVIQLGDQIGFLLPADDFFAPKSTAIKTSSFPKLNQVARVLTCYKKSDVSVAAYTNRCGDPRVNRSITEQQARLVSDYLWLRGVDARVLFPDAKGASDPWCAAIRQQSDALNRRIEIRFTRLTQPLL